MQNAMKSLPKTPNHKIFCDKLNDPAVTIVLATGAAGTGKTHMSVSYAVFKLLSKCIKKIIITRPTVPLEEELGHLPGKLQDKMHPYLIPMYDSLKEYMTPARLQEYLVNEEIDICAIAHIRGRTFHDSWILVDEAQNLTRNQFKTLLTRIGQNSKMVLSGDLQQSDLKENNGLQDFVDKFKQHTLEYGTLHPIDLVEFGEEDIMRSDIVKRVLHIYDSSS